MCFSLRVFPLLPLWLGCLNFMGVFFPSPQCFSRFQSLYR
uniref:Uncharacterized protein n=1 Tax=Manihot esculenta TaxID=3983 RepID=A0A2C9V2J1_MANES